MFRIEYVYFPSSTVQQVKQGLIAYENGIVATIFAKIKIIAQAKFSPKETKFRKNRWKFAFSRKWTTAFSFQP